jgi:sarcosine oxidase, subunit gamma
VSAVEFASPERRSCLGLKGPRAEEWLHTRGIGVPAAANSWNGSDTGADEHALTVARLGQSEFFLEAAAAGDRLPGIAAALGARPAGVYPVLRQDWGFELRGDKVHEVLAQVCNINFAALLLDSHPVVMTLMIGVAVLVLPRAAGDGRSYRFWCDPTYGPSLSETVAAVVAECGGTITGVSK